MPQRHFHLRQNPPILSDCGSVALGFSRHPGLKHATIAYKIGTG
jgi:hypothetical protein